MQKHFSAIVLVLIFFIIGISTYHISLSPTSKIQSPTGYAIIKVIEDGSLKPITNATVCIIETKTYHQTNKYGYTEKIPIPIIPNKNYDISLQRQYGEFTILIYAPGYTTLISYYNEAYSGMTNAGIVCKLPLIINSTDPLVITHANKPPDDYSASLVQLYRK